MYKNENKTKKSKKQSKQRAITLKINQKGIPWKLGKGEPPFLHATHCHYVIHIPIKLHVVNALWRLQECKINKISLKLNQRAIT